MAVDTATAERAALIEKYVHYDAVEVFVQALAQLDAGNDQEAFPMSVLTGNDGEVDLGAGRLGDELWPTEGDYDAADGPRRSSAAVARVFALLATDAGRNYCATQAAFFAGLAAKAPERDALDPAVVFAEAARLRAAGVKDET